MIEINGLQDISKFQNEDEEADLWANHCLGDQILDQMEGFEDISLIENEVLEKLRQLPKEKYIIKTMTNYRKDGIMEDTIQLTPDQIAKYRADLANNTDALAALDSIEECDGDLADATESIATLNGIEGVEDNADMRWFFIVLNKCRDSICQPKYETLRKEYLPQLIPPLTDIIAGCFMCPSGVAGLLSTPVAIYISRKGMDKFCQTSTDS